MEARASLYASVARLTSYPRIRVQDLVNSIADVAIASFPADMEALKVCKLANGETVESYLPTDRQSGEKHSLVAYHRLNAPMWLNMYTPSMSKLGLLLHSTNQFPSS